MTLIKNACKAFTIDNEGVVSINFGELCLDLIIVFLFYKN